MKHFRLLLGILVLTAAAGPVQANITSTSLRIEGVGLKVINDPPVTTGIDMPTTIQTSFGNRQNEEAPSLEGLLAVGELTGPGLDTPIPLTTAPGHKFQIPGLQKEGVYYLQNIRLMKGDEFLQYATPAATQIIVADLLKTKVTVRQLSADEIRARGIVIDARNFDVYEFSFTFIIDGKEVVIPFPVIVDPRTHQVQPVPREFPFNIPGPGLIEPPRWTPPAVIPLDFGEEGELPEPGKDPVEWRPRGARPSMPAAIVIPNGLAVMHQFFAVSMMVTNGAPEGSAARLENIRATMRIENPGALRTVKTVPEVSFGAPVPIVDPESGTTFLVAQARGEAEWTMEGLQPGTHRVDFDLRATLRQPGQDDVLLRATPSAAIVIHNPRFNITFSHPDVVRKGIEYSTYAFLTNLGESEREVTVTSGVPECGNASPDANVCRLNGGVTDLLRIAPGEMKLIEYKLRPGVTGQVFATAGTLSDTDVLSAAVSLHMGVSESGIPLSPATLILPYYAQFVSPSVLSANLELFGLGYSLATAPLTPVTARFPRVIKTDVFTRAVDVARAGQRIFITNNNAQSKRDSIMHMSLDLLGNSGYELREWDALRRTEKSGRKAGAANMRELEALALTDGVTMESFVDDFAEVTAHRGAFLAALAHGNGTGERPYAIALVGNTSGRTSSLNNEAEIGWKRDLPFSDISRFNGAGRSGELALMGRWPEDVDVKITPAVTGPFDVELIYPHATEGRVQRAHFTINGTQGQTITIPVARGANALNAFFPNNGIAAIGTISTVDAAPLRLEGARQDMHLDDDGHKVSILFNRPVKTAEGVDLRTRFTGAIDFNRDGVVYKAPRPISAAALQEDGRTVNVTFDHTLSVNAAYTIEAGSLVDPISMQAVTFPDKVSPKIDNDRPAGVIYGKVLKGDNTPIAGADVVIRQYLPLDGSPNPRGAPQYDVSQQDGAFLFEYIRRQTDLQWSGAYRLEGFKTENGKTTLEGSVRLPGKVHFVNLQFLGRGAAQGTVRYNDGTVVAGADVVVGSTMFDQFRTAKTDGNGFYSIEDLPVGPLTFSAKDEKGNVTFAASEIATPGQLVTQNLSIYRAPFPGTGHVYGTVRRSDTNAVLAGVRVGVYSQGYGLAETRTDAAGHYEFTKVPAGFITVLAAEYSVAPQAVALDYDLKADETKQVDVLLFVPTQEKNTKLTGEVFREKATAPGTYERVPGALVKIDGYKIVTADAEGKFTYENLPTLFSQKNITAYDPATQRIKSVSLPTLTEAGPNNVSITIAAFDRGYGTIRVRLLNAAGKPVPNYRVILPGFPPDELIEVGSGIYELRNVPVGPSYEIWAVSNGVRPEDGSPDPRPYGSQVAHGSAKVAFNGHIAALTLRLPGQGTVRVKVRSQFDLISDVSLTHSIWWEGEQRMVSLPLYASTNKNGEADWAVFDKVPALAGYGVASGHPQYGAASEGGTLAFDGDFNDHVLQLNTLAKVSGTVYAIDGVTPIAGATVRINNGRSDPGPQLTGPDGRFVFHDQPSAVNVYVTAEVTQSGVYRIGVGQARTPNNGGFVDNMAVILRKRGFVDGKVVYKDYKRFDPNNAANNLPDDTPGDYSDNAPVPLAKFHLRELDYPGRTFGTPALPLSADVGGRFQINNVFVGSLRATAWDSGNEELRGDWVGSIDEEGEEATPKAYIAIGGGGVGELEVTVVDPNQSYVEVINADVSLYAGGLWDLTTTGSTGKALFQELPVGTYSVAAYSKALGKSSRAESVTITRDGTATARLELEFSGTVDGTLTDPEEGNAPVPGSHVRLTASNYQQQSTTDVAGAFLFLGVREGTFRLDAKDTDTNRRATAERTLTVLDPHRTVNLELEPLETLHFAAYLPNDTGGNSGILAAPQRVEVKQRCWRDLAGAEHCDFRRQLQGNPIQFPGVFENSGYGIVIFEAAENRENVGLGGAFPLGTAANPFKYVFPAFGDVQVNVTQGGAPASGAKVSIYSSGKTVTAYTDASGTVTARGLRLGGVSVQAQSSDERFTGSASLTLARTSVMPVATIALGTYAGVTGKVLAEAGGPSVGTRVVAHFPGGSGTGEIRTNENGEYTFLGIPTSGSGATRVNLTFIGPDDTTVGAYAFKDLFAGDGVETVSTVTLDATRPEFEAIVPADNSTNVSPDTAITVTFSEAIAAGSINTNNFQLVASDGSGNVNCQLSTKIVDGKFAVVMTPPKPATGFPLRSNTLYRVIISSAITDDTGHKLPAPLGFTFTTTDYTEPRVLKVLPANPIPKTTTFEFRFNEQVDPAPWAPGGNGTFHVYKLFAPGGQGAAVDRELVANAFLDPNRMALFIGLDDAVTNRIEPESFYRVVFNGVKDDQGNPMPEQTHHFYSFDEVAPHVVFNSPLETVQLVSGSEYEIKLDFKNGSPTGTTATDIKEVRYFTIGADNLPKQFAFLQAAPFTVKIVGPEAPPAGLQYTIGAQARDTSGNEGPMTRITWTVKPNAAPTNVVVTPVQASSYPSLPVSARVTFDDEGSFASVLATFSVPKSDGTTATQNLTKEVNRLSNGQWPETLFTYTIPATATPGAVVTVTATVTDVRGLVSAPASATIEVTPDTVQPVILSVTPPAGTTFFNTNKYFIEAIVKDAETGVKTVTFTVDGEPVALGSTSAGPTPGTQKFRSVQVEARAKADDANIPIVVTAKDYNNNARSTSYEVLYKGVNDPDAPKVTWLCPVDKGALPAETSFALKLRLRVVDEDIRSVKFLINGQTVTAAVTGTDEYGATHNFTTPAPGTLTITAVVEDTVETHKVELPITLDVVAADFKLQDALAITNDNKGTYQGKTIALIGSGAVLAPQVPLTLANLLVLNGARVETLASTITREFKVDIITTGITYVDCDSSVNVNEKGYVGGWANTSDGQNNTLHARTVGNTSTGGADSSSAGSHAGLGGIADGTFHTNAPYGSIARPTELGSGGGGHPSCCTAGLSGGGAIALRGGSGEDDTSRIVIAGTLLANGGHTVGGRWAAASGGSVWIEAKHVELGPKAVVSANGGDNAGGSVGSWGGGGGRVAMTATTKLDLSTATIEARGGRNSNTPENRAATDGGAGTVYVRKPGQEAGELTVSSLDSRFPSSGHSTRPTPLGRIRKGTSTALAASALTDASRTFDKWMIGEELVLGGDTSRSFTVVGVSGDGKSLQTDPNDGSMLAAAGAQSVAYAGMLAFDKVTVGKRALAVFDEHISAGGVVDDRTSMLVDPTGAVVLHNEQITTTITTVPPAGGNIVLDTPLAVTHTIQAAAGVRSLEFFWSLDSTPRSEVFNDYPVSTPTKTFNIHVPSTAPLGPALLNMRVTDRAGRTYDLPARSYTIAANSGPVIDSFTVAPTSIYAGHSVTATVTATDDISVKNISFDAKLNGASIKTASHTPNTVQATQTFTVPLTNEVAGGTPFTIDVAVSDGFGGRAPTTASLPVTILTDTVAPQVTIISPAAGASYRESVDKIPVRVAATDAEVAVKEGFAQLDGGTPVPLVQFGTTNEWRADITAPPVDGEADVQRQVTITVKDYAGNAYVSTPIDVTIKPVIDSNAPVLKWLCATQGAMFPAGQSIKLRVSAVAANAQNPVQTVQMVLEDTGTPLTVASLGSNQYEATYAIPADTAEGTVVRVRASAASAGGASSDLLTSFTVIVPTAPVISASMTIEAANTTYDNKTVVITGGTVTIRGAHTFDRLIVMGGNVVHLRYEKMDITTTRGLYVACGGAIDVTGLGYNTNETYPGERAAGHESGGSHMGRGGVRNNGPSGSTFGSVYRPQEAGGGGDWHPNPGGGVIRIQAGSVFVDGAIRVNGARHFRGGAGGSIWITAPKLGGAGIIDASGATADDYGAGGGGAIAIEYTDPTTVLPTLRNSGGRDDTDTWYRHGGAGTTYLRGPTSTYGTLLLNNEQADAPMTELPSLGTGAAQTGTTGATVVTNRSSNIQPYFVGHWIEITDAAGALKGTWRIQSVNAKNFTLAPNGTETINVVAGDTWQGVYRFDRLDMRNHARVSSVDPIRTTHDIVLSGPASSELYVHAPLSAKNITITGRVAAHSLSADDMTIAAGAVLTHPHILSGSSAGRGVTVNVKNTLTIDGSIDVTSRGYEVNQTYPGERPPGHESGGSHMGRGGVRNNGPSGNTYGSVYRPQEAGSGGDWHPNPGGGIVRIISGTTVLNGSIRALGGRHFRGGAGGSIWITTDKIYGSGSIDASGATADDYGAGGGGAIAVEYTDSSSTLPTIRNSGGRDDTDAGFRHGGAGTTYVRGPAAIYGTLIVDNEQADAPLTELPSIGNGTAQPGTAGATVITNRSANFQPYFVGHWVEITDAAGVLKGTWRIASVNAKNFTLAPNGTETIAVVAGDKWQGVYRFDKLEMRRYARMSSVDPIRTTDEIVLAGPTSSEIYMHMPIGARQVRVTGRVAAHSITADDMTIEAGAVLTHPSIGSGYPGTRGLTLDVKNTLTIDGSIDVTSRGYDVNTTYPNERPPAHESGGSHMGRGGVRNSGPSGNTYGSITRPQEPGSGGDWHPNPGGGVVRITSGTTIVNGSIRALGGRHFRGGAGGSIWITTTKISGAGTIDASGATADDYGAGGGGAISIEYTDATSNMPTIRNSGGRDDTNAEHRNAGAGTTFIRGAGEVHGTLIVDNEADAPMTELPSLGSGVAQAATSGATVVTNRSANFQPYHVGHWVEISDTEGTLKGTWRIASANLKTFTLEPNGVETIDVVAGDRWQGIHRFDNFELRKYGRVTSVDPIRTTENIVLAGPASSEAYLQSALEAKTVTVTGRVAAHSLKADNMTVATGAVLTHPMIGSGHATGRGLSLQIANTLTINGTIDVTGRGYDVNQTYPNERAAAHESGGSHLGRGGVRNSGPSGSTFGSIYRPQEAGGGGDWHPNPGGGVVRIQSGTTVLNGSILALGTRHFRGGAGGSVWITTGKITGGGSINASGATADDYGAGGGGAISLEYTDPTSVLPALTSSGGRDDTNAAHRNGAAGSVFVFGPASTYGDVTIANTVSTSQPVQLPNLGRGTAMAGTAGGRVVTNLGTFQPYFGGHYVDVFNPDGTRKGTWRIASIETNAFVLQPNGAETVNVLPGDTWRGVYLFDKMTLRGAAVQLLDDTRAQRDLDGASSLTINDAPVFNQLALDDIVVTSRGDGDFVIAPFGTVNDLHPPILMTATNVRTGTEYTAQAAADGSFQVQVGGIEGDTFVIRARDSYSMPATSFTYPVNGSITGVNGVSTVSVTPSSITGGGTVTGTVRMLFPVRIASDGVVALSSSSSSATLPATVTIPVGNVSAPFNITTSVVSSDTTVTITAAAGARPAQSATLTILAGASALTQLTLDANSVEGGTSINGTVVLGAAAPAGGATVILRTSDTRLATVPDVIVVPEGETSRAFTITTYGVTASSSVTITGTYGATASATATLSACTSLGVAPQPPAFSLDATWIDESLPSGATVTGDGVLDTTQAATGSSAIHLSGAAPGIRKFTVTLATPVAVGPNDKLVFYVLVNPCAPPRQIMAAWKTSTTDYRASWGESVFDINNTYVTLGGLPRGGEWRRMEVLAKTLGINANVSLTELTVRAIDGEAWFDSMGRKLCVLEPNAPPPALHPNEIVWFDDALPAGALEYPELSTRHFFKWDTTQAASGSQSHKEALQNGLHEHAFYGATDKLVTGAGDILYAYVYLDPCNPPKQVMLNFYENGSWEHRAYWGENLINWGSNGQPSRYRVGPLPEVGKWVRLEVPATRVGLRNHAIEGAAFVLYDGQAWFDRSGKIARTNLALKKTATQASNYSADHPASKAVDGDLSSPSGASITTLHSRPWWQVDLGAVYPIEDVDVIGRTDCCASQTSNFYLFVSDEPFTSTVIENTHAQPGVSSYAFGGQAGGLVSFQVNRTGRYIRIHTLNNDHLTLPEVQVWAPIKPTRVNFASGLRMGATAISMWDGWAHPAYGVNGTVNYAHQSGGSIFHTRNNETDPWFDLDLGEVKLVGNVDVWPRIDCCFSGSTKLWLFASDVPFTSKAFAATQAQPGVSAYYYGTPETMFISFNVNRTARYLRVARSGVTDVGFAELQVWTQQAVLPAYSRSQESPPER